MTCQQCGHDLIPVNLWVADEYRVAVARLIGTDYSVGPGSGIPLPGLLCGRCGQVQTKDARALDTADVVSEHRAGTEGEAS